MPDRPLHLKDASRTRRIIVWGDANGLLISEGIRAFTRGRYNQTRIFLRPAEFQRIVEWLKTSGAFDAR